MCRVSTAGTASQPTVATVTGPGPAEHLRRACGRGCRAAAGVAGGGGLGGSGRSAAAAGRGAATAGAGPRRNTYAVKLRPLPAPADGALERCHTCACPRLAAERADRRSRAPGFLSLLGWQLLGCEQSFCQAPPGYSGLPTGAGGTQTSDAECRSGRRAGKAGWHPKPGRVGGRRRLCRAASAGAPRTQRAGAPDMLTAKQPTSSSGPKPSSAITAAGSRPRIARCTTATPRSSGAAANRRPKARLAASGMPSQNEYACVAGASDATCRAQRGPR